MAHITKVEYGKLAMLRVKCPICGDTSLIVDGEMQGCGHRIPMPDTYDKKKKESEGRKDRDRLGKKDKDAILASQNNLCFYCGRPFGLPVWHPRRRKVIYANLVFDHFLCWDFSRDSRKKNMVAACCICNGIKGSKIFANAEDARAYINHRIGEKGYEYNFNGEFPENSTPRAT